MKASRLDLTAIVPVRRGSKGLPGKNIRQFGGKPLYLWAVEQGVRIAGRCVVTTDIPEIRSEHLPQGAIRHQRPIALAQDETMMSDVLLNAIDELGIDSGTVLLLQATSPLRTDRDIENVLELYKTGRYPLVFSVSDTDSVVLKNGYLDGDRFVPLAQMKYLFENRQALPRTCKPNGAIYVFDVQWFKRNGGFQCASAGAIRMNAEHSADIDTIADFERAEKIFLQFQDLHVRLASALVNRDLT